VKQTLRKPLKFIAILLPISAVAGFFTSIYSFGTLRPELKEVILSQNSGYQIMLLSGTIQTIILASVFGYLGYLLSEKIGLLRPFRIERDPLFKVLGITALCGIAFSLDYWTFARIIPILSDIYDAEITLANVVSSVLYGGIIEEILLRLFLMSLIVFIIWKLFFRKLTKDEIPMGVFIGANILAALLFAAGHLPATVGIFGALTPVLLIRCFLLNGGLGLVFGWLYRRYGIQYAVVAHMGTHITSKLIWTLFIG